MGGILAQKSPLPIWSFAALDALFLGLQLLSTVVALFISFFTSLVQRVVYNCEKIFF